MLGIPFTSLKRDTERAGLLSVLKRCILSKPTVGLDSFQRLYEPTHYSAEMRRRNPVVKERAHIMVG